MPASFLIEQAPPHPGRLIRRALMRNYNLTIDELAEKTGIHRSDLLQVIDEKRDLSPEFVNRVRKVFRRVADTLVEVQFAYDFYKDYGRRPSLQERLIKQQAHHSERPFEA